MPVTDLDAINEELKGFFADPREDGRVLSQFEVPHIAAGILRHATTGHRAHPLDMKRDIP